MKIEIINNDPSGCSDYKIYDRKNNRTLRKDSGVFPLYFDENDISIILNEKQMQAFNSGRYEFDVSEKILSLIDNHYLKASYLNDKNYLKQLTSLNQ